MNAGQSEGVRDTKPQLALTFSADGRGGSWLSRRHVSFPYSMGAPFALDENRPNLPTVILQSASGGLYRGESLASHVTVENHAQARIVTPGAASVYSARGGEGAVQRVALRVEPHGRLAFLPRANILFPGARLAQTISAEVAETGRLLLRDGFAMHRPAGANGVFDRLELRVDIGGASGSRLLAERSIVAGGTLEQGIPGVGGDFRAFGSLIVIAPGDPQLVETIVTACADALHSQPFPYCGISRLRDNKGLLLRIAAVDGGALEQATDKLVEMIEPMFFS